MRTLLLLPLCLCLAAPARAATTLTYVDLVRRLTDLEALAVLPPPGEKGAQWSSYDRASVYDAASGKYLRWDANGDGHGIIRREGETEVLAEMDGPGCIWRIWSATVHEGHVKIYLDGAAQPAVDLPFKGYFDHMTAPFNYPALVHTTTANGYNSYVPIPYRKSCKIVAEKGWGDYYHFTYSTFPPDTVVPTFTRDLGEPEKAALAAADKFLSQGGGTDPAPTFAPRTGEQTVTANLTVPPGGAATAVNLAGPRAITGLRVKMEPLPAADKIAATLREVALRIRWDGEKTPSVAVPLGDFFGSAPGINLYQSLPLGMTADGFYSFWYMPFATGAHVEFVNDGAQPITLQVGLTHAPLARPIATLGRFHAKWHRDALLPDPATGRAIDWTMLKTEGRGRFCGVMLHIWNPKGHWWGEGDEKFFVDGEKFPSTFGTGSEDYFGYAWSSMKPFRHALHNQPNADARTGNNSVNRWHIADNVPFQTSFEGAIEKYFPNARPTLYACTAYWYLSAGGVDSYDLPPVAERTGYFEQVIPAFRVAGAIEGESLRVLEKTGGNVGEQGMEDFDGNWSNASQLFWTGAKPGAKLTLALPVLAAGKYEITAQMTKAKDYGIVQLTLDGQKLGQPIDLYNDGVIPTGILSLGTLDLAAGEHKLTLEITGANDKAIQAYMVGLDFVKLQAAK